MEDSEYFIQLFLFSATIFCYVLLFGFIVYGVYYCCVRNCLRTRRKRQNEERMRAETDSEECEYNSSSIAYPGQVTLINPFQGNQKAAIIVPTSNNTNIHATSQSQDTNIIIPQVTPNSNSALMENNVQNAFTDKKYYDIFM